MIALLALLAASAPVETSTAATVAVHISALAEVPLGDGLALAELLAREIAAHSGRRVLVDDPAWSCETADCAAEVRARTRAGEVVFARIFGGPTRIHVLLARAGARRAGTDVFVPQEHAGWRDPLARAAAALFPEPRVITLPIPIEARVEAPVNVWPWLAIGTGVLAAGAAITCGAVNAGARADIRAGPLPAGEHQALASRVEATGVAANVLAGAAIAGVTAGVVMLLLE